MRAAVERLALAEARELSRQIMEIAPVGQEVRTAVRIVHQFGKPARAELIEGGP